MSEEDATSFMFDHIPNELTSLLRAEHVAHDLNQLGLYGLYDFVHVVVKHWGSKGQARGQATSTRPQHSTPHSQHAPFIFVNFVNKFAAGLFRQAVESDRLHCRTFKRVKYANKQGFLQQVAEYANFEFYEKVMIPKTSASRWSRIRNPSFVPLIFKRVPRRGEVSHGIPEKFVPPWTVYAFPMAGQKFYRNLLRLSFDLSEGMLPPISGRADELWFEMGPVNPLEHASGVMDLNFDQPQTQLSLLSVWRPICRLYEKSWALRKNTNSDFAYLLATRETLGGFFFDAALGFQNPTYAFYFVPAGVNYATLQWIVAAADAERVVAGDNVSRDDRAATLAREVQIAERLQETVATLLSVADKAVWAQLKRVRDHLWQQRVWRWDENPTLVVPGTRAKANRSRNTNKGVTVIDVRIAHVHRQTVDVSSEGIGITTGCCGSGTVPCCSRRKRCSKIVFPKVAKWSKLPAAYRCLSLSPDEKGKRWKARTHLGHRHPQGHGDDRPWPRLQFHRLQEHSSKTRVQLLWAGRGLVKHPPLMAVDGPRKNK
eukprot:g18150.t1